MVSLLSCVDVSTLNTCTRNSEEAIQKKSPERMFFTFDCWSFGAHPLHHVSSSFGPKIGFFFCACLWVWILIYPGQASHKIKTIFHGRVLGMN